MKNYLNITSKYLKTQKKRSVLTVMGIVLSVALLTGIGTLFTSMWGATVEEAVRQNGDFYAQISNVPAAKVDALIHNVQTANSGLSSDLGFAPFAKNEGNEKQPPSRYFVVKALDTSAQVMLPYTLMEGRMPSSADEIVLDYWATQYFKADFRLGEQLSLELGERTNPDGSAIAEAVGTEGEGFHARQSRLFTVVGFLKPSYIINRNFATALTYIDLNNLEPSGRYTTYLKLDSVRNVHERIRAIAESAGLDTKEKGKNRILYNEKVLRLFAQSLNDRLNDSMMMVLLVIVSLVILSTIAVIYNAFNISVIERVSQFGLLRCVGATPRQIKRIVFKEAFTLGAIGIPIGVIGGTVAMKVVFEIIERISSARLFGELKMIVNPYILLISILLGAVTIAISAMLPARKAAKISPMEAVRGTGILKKEKYRRTDRLRIVYKLLGAEGWIAWKNLGRNRRRFYITVFSMVISIVLFIVFNSLVNDAFASGFVDTTNVPNYTIWKMNSSEPMELSDAQYRALRQTEGVEYVLKYGTENAVVELDENKINEDAFEYLNLSPKKDGKGNVILRSGLLVCYGDDALWTHKKNIESGAYDVEAMNRQDGVIIVQSALMYDSANKRSVITDIAHLKPGDLLTITTGSMEENNKKTKQVKVLSVLKQGFLNETRVKGDGIYVIATEKLYHELMANAPYPQTIMVNLLPNADRTQVKAFLNDFMALNPDCNLSDLDQAAKDYNQGWMVLSIFLYGFVAVITLIGSLNIINTVSTNIILRTKELSVMRAIGMSEKGMKKLVSLESILHGAAAALFGSVVGTLLSYLIHGSISGAREFPWTFPGTQIAIAVAGAALIAVISGYVPLKRINNGVIIEGIRGEE